MIGRILLSFVTILFSELLMAVPGYDTIANDPFKVRTHTLENGLKVYMSVNKSKPRIQSFICVRAGGKNDPSETTGLAHYFEHLMFKGTQNVGTVDYATEKPFLDKIESLYEKYRNTSEKSLRKQIYAEIDSISQEASKIAIPNEYVKLMASIGANNTNAFTDYDFTAFLENIPSNQIENWAKIQSDRFTNPVIRLFHTELETVYEEYNMSLTRDSKKMNDTLMNMLFPHHPYGAQSGLGTEEHLRNPSITNLKKFYETYYVPNNMAIVLVGDLDPDSAIKLIDKYFGKMKSHKIPTLNVGSEAPIYSPVIKEVTGLESEQVAIGFRLPAAGNKDNQIAELVAYMLSNGKAGLIDINLIQKQKVLGARASAKLMTDYGIFQLTGRPKENQTPEQVRALLLEQIEELRNGKYDDSYIKSCVNNLKLDRYYQQQEQTFSAYLILMSYINGIDWKDEVHKNDFQAKLTKEDITAFCNRYFDNNYAIVYKHQGEVETRKMEKPAITPININRNEQSSFFKDIENSHVEPIEPVFLDYSKDLSNLTMNNNISVLYKQNITNPIFSLHYVFDMGNDNDRMLGTAFEYLNYLGTTEQTAEEIKNELFGLACSFKVSVTDTRAYVSISGLNENFEQSLALLESKLSRTKTDIAAYDNLVMGIIKNRANAKTNQKLIFDKLTEYAKFGTESVYNVLSEQELKTMNPDDLVKRIAGLKNYDHKILYYGPLAEKHLLNILNAKHVTTKKKKIIPASGRQADQEINENDVLLVHYDSKQAFMSFISKGVKFDANIEPVRILYNNCINSVALQEIREARALAYSVEAGYSLPAKPAGSYYFSAFIATQNDKINDANDVFHSIIKNLPESDKSLEISKENIITGIRTERIAREDVLWNYLKSTEFGYTTDPRIELFNKIPSLTLKDIKAFHEKYVKNLSFINCILGNTADLNMINQPSKKVSVLTSEKLFGY